MATVQSQVLRLAQAVCPRTKTDVLFTLANIGTLDGDLLTAQKFVDVYNEARNTLQAQLHAFTRGRGIEVSENIKYIANLSFTSGVATKPDGLVETILLTSASGTEIPAVPASDEEYILDEISTTNPAVVEDGTTYRDPSGGTNVPNAATYKLRYVYVPQYVSADVTGGATLESFNEKWHWSIIEIATAIANSLGQRDVLAITQLIVKKVVTGN